MKSATRTTASVMIRERGIGVGDSAVDAGETCLGELEAFVFILKLLFITMLYS